MISTDDGLNWHNGGETDAACEPLTPNAVRGTDEPAIVELDDGSVYMLMRTGSDHLYQARSTDEGKTWTAIGPSPLRGSNAPAALCNFQVDGRRGFCAYGTTAGAVSALRRRLLRRRQDVGQAEGHCRSDRRTAGLLSQLRAGRRRHAGGRMAAADVWRLGRAVPVFAWIGSAHVSGGWHWRFASAPFGEISPRQHGGVDQSWTVHQLDVHGRLGLHADFGQVDFHLRAGRAESSEFPSASQTRICHPGRAS